MKTPALRIAARQSDPSQLNNEKLTFAEEEIIQIKIQYRPGEIARVASRLGKANTNVNYAYCGLEPSTNAEGELPLAKSRMAGN